jgi:hypothetical protein
MNIWSISLGGWWNKEGRMRYTMDEAERYGVLTHEECDDARKAGLTIVVSDVGPIEELPPALDSLVR